MKKLISLVLALVMCLSLCSSAFAVELVVDGKSTANNSAFEEVLVPLAYNGRLAGRLPNEKLTHVDPYKGNGGDAIVKDVKSNGGILRAVNAVKCELDENGYLNAGATTVRMGLVVTNEEAFDETGVSPDTFSVVDALIIWEEGWTSVRVMADPKNEVARLYFEDGSFLAVYYEEYTYGCFRLVLNIEPFNSASANNGGGNQGGDDNQGDQGSGNQGDNDQGDQGSDNQGDNDQGDQGSGDQGGGDQGGSGDQGGNDPVPNPSLRPRTGTSTTQSTTTQSTTTQPTTTQSTTTQSTTTQSGSGTPNPGLRGR